MVLDEVFGSDNFQNEIIWRRANTHNDPGGYGRIHDTLLYYRRPQGAFSPVYGDYREEYLEQAYRHVDPDGRRYRLLPLHATHVFSANDDNTRRFEGKILRPPHGKYWRWSQKKIDEALTQNLIVISKNNIPQYKKYLDEAEGVPIQSIWDDLKMLARPEMVDYPTQKPESLLERIIKSSSSEGDLVLDCFCGSGTTAAVAEKLGRRWITCDLGRFAIHTARKRLLDIQSVKPFVVQNLGKYERQLWQADEFGPQAVQRVAAYTTFILDLYHARPLAGRTWLHGVKGNRVVHVGSIDSPVTLADVRSIIIEWQRNVGKSEVRTTGIDVLGWDFAFELNEVARQQALDAGVDLKFYTIPREVLEKKAVEQGDIQFFELAALFVDTRVSGRTLTLELTNFVPPLDYVPQEIRSKITAWESWIDYWAVDFDFKGDTFHNEWQSYRTKANKAIATTTTNTYDSPGTYCVNVKVIDILGNDTTRTLHIEVA